MRARTESFVVLHLLLEDGIEPAAGFHLRHVLNEIAPDFWQFFSPGTFVVCFRSRKRGLRRARRLESRLAALAASDARFRDLRTGLAEGPLVAEFGWLGQVRSLPVGEAAVEAGRRARSGTP